MITVETTVYKSLDKKSSFLKLKGAYFKYTVLLLAIDIIPAMYIGSILNSVIGVISYIILMFASYLGVLAVQAKYTERELKKFISSRSIPRFIIVKPDSLYHQTYPDKKNK